MPNEDTTLESIATELTRFQLEILYLLANENDHADYGLGIKRSLEDYYGNEVNHGRLYPNLDTLAEHGLIERSARDKRTNDYALTADGREVLRRDAQRRHAIMHEAPATPDPEEMPEPAASGGGD